MSRTNLSADLTINVDPGHLQEACNHVVNDYDCQGKMIYLQLTLGAEYTDQIEVATQPLSAHVFTIRGCPTNPGSVMWTPHVAGACVRATDFGAVVVDGVELGFYVSGPNLCAAAYQFGIIDLQNIIFGSCGGGAHISSSYHGAVNITGPYSIQGNASNHIRCTTLGKVNLGANPVSMPAPLSFDAFALVEDGGWVGVGGVPYTGAGAGGATNGKRYDVKPSGILKLNGVTFPGNLAGTSTGFLT